MNLHALGWDPHWDQSWNAAAAAVTADCRPGRVVAVHRDRFVLWTADGETDATACGLLRRGDIDPAAHPVVGDWVVCQPDGVVLGVLPRRTCVVRRQPGPGTPRPQPIAGNVDTLLLVVGLDGNYRPSRVERYLTIAWDSGAQPVVVLTKADCDPDPVARQREVSALAAGAPVHAISVHTGWGVDELAAYQQPGTTLALIGSSGVGKSTLLNAWLGDGRQRVTEVREDDSKGRHTTTHRELFALASGALVIDTPGMRELGLWQTDDGVAETFADIEALAEDCRFADCSHESEPGCAVKAALSRGDLSPARLASYHHLQQEAAGLAGLHRRFADIEDRRTRQKLVHLFGGKLKRR
ncbi:MAG: ribosome small subunit-dependent GTPase A [Armatimonadetes bacterium]|nr:ribosome small subunit-dependent GTPase A [Armatimonadota bacterium]